MAKKIERIRDLFDDKTCQRMLNWVRGKGECHRNAVTMYWLLYKNENKVKYVEGYLGLCGHCINSIERNGVTHYFDISQEWMIGKGLKKDFIDEIDVVYEQLGKVVWNRVVKEHMYRMYKVQPFIWNDKKRFKAA